MSSGHAPHAPPPSSRYGRRRGGELFSPSGGRALTTFATPVHTVSTVAAAQGHHGRDLIRSSSSLLLAVQALARGL